MGLPTLLESDQQVTEHLRVQLSLRRQNFLTAKVTLRAMPDRLEQRRCDLSPRPGIPVCTSPHSSRKLLASNKISHQVQHMTSASHSFTRACRLCLCRSARSPIFRSRAPSPAEHRCTSWARGRPLPSAEAFRCHDTLEALGCHDTQESLGGHETLESFKCHETLEPLRGYETLESLSGHENPRIPQGP